MILKVVRYERTLLRLSSQVKRSVESRLAFNSPKNHALANPVGWVAVFPTQQNHVFPFIRGRAWDGVLDTLDLGANGARHPHPTWPVRHVLVYYKVHLHQ